MRASMWALAALGVAACAHAQTRTAAPAPVQPPPAVATAAPAPPPPLPAAPPVQPAPASCTTDDQCASSELCVAAACVPIDQHLAECRAASAHFDFDRAELHPDDLPRLQRMARCLQAMPAEPTLVAGNCDERGTVEYNIVLGQRRADAVAKYLEELGVPSSELEAVSYGKELGVCSEDTEACFTRNRRTDVKFDTQPRDMAALFRAAERREHAQLASAKKAAPLPSTAAGRRPQQGRRSSHDRRAH